MLKPGQSKPRKGLINQPPKNLDQRWKPRSKTPGKLSALGFWKHDEEPVTFQLTKDCYQFTQIWKNRSETLASAVQWRQEWLFIVISYTRNVDDVPTSIFWGHTTLYFHFHQYISTIILHVFPCFASAYPTKQQIIAKRKKKQEDEINNSGMLEPLVLISYLVLAKN